MGLSDSGISTLLNSLGSGKDGSTGFDFAGYASIKNGSYGKLVKSYYAEQTGAAGKTASEVKSTSNAKTAKTTKKEDSDTTGLSQMKKDAQQLKTSAEKLSSDDMWKKTDGKLDMSKVASAVKDFAADYNKVIDQAGKVSSKEIGQDMKFMTSMTDTFTKVLAKVGVSVGSDGKLSVDEEKLAKADEATVQSLFKGNATYGSQIADKASAIARDADMNSSIYGSNAETSSTLSSIYNQLI